MNTSTTRRTALRTLGVTLWAAPVVHIAAAAPAYATSETVERARRTAQTTRTDASIARTVTGNRSVGTVVISGTPAATDTCLTLTLPRDYFPAGQPGPNFTTHTPGWTSDHHFAPAPDQRHTITMLATDATHGHLTFALHYDRTLTLPTPTPAIEAHCTGPTTHSQTIRPVAAHTPHWHHADETGVRALS